MGNFNNNKNINLIRVFFVGAIVVATTGVVGIKLGRADITITRPLLQEADLEAQQGIKNFFVF